MGQRFAIDNKQIVDAGDLSGDVTSGAVDTLLIDSIGIEVTTTGTHAGNLFIQGSNTGDNWANATSAVAVSNGATYIISASD